MATHLRLSSLAPSGLIVESIAENEDAVVVSARARARVRACPLCGTQSSRVNSRYVRIISDWPCAGRSVGLRLLARRFVCERPSCRRRIFAERFDDGAVAARCRRTTRLECIVHHLGLALGGRRPAASFAKRRSATTHCCGSSDAEPACPLKLSMWPASMTGPFAVIIAMERSCHRRKLVRQIIRGESTDVFLETIPRTSTGS